MHKLLKVIGCFIIPGVNWTKPAHLWHRILTHAPLAVDLLAFIQEATDSGPQSIR